MSWPFQKVGKILYDKGYSIIPIIKGQKYPLIKNWSEYCAEKADQETFNRWLEWEGCNIGLCLGEASGVTALDFDNDVEGLHAEILKIIPDSPIKKKGAKGFTAFYKYSGERSGSLRKGGETVLDILSTGRQTVIPPSVHPSGAAYEYITADTLENYTGILPALGAEVIAKIYKLAKGAMKEPRPHREYKPEKGSDISDALSYISPDDYFTWIHIGMALKEAGEQFGMWDAWSASSPKYAGSQETRKKWDSFNSTGIHIESLFYYAIEGGYVPKREYALDNLPSVTIEPGGNLYAEAAIEKVREYKEDEKQRGLINSAPGLVGLITEHINACSMFPQPFLALGAALSMAGIIMANKVQTRTGLRTNVYTLGVAESAAGKDQARKVCKAMLAGTNLAYMEIGTPKSGAGLLSGLRKGNGMGIMFIDEFGRYLSTLTQAKAANHEREITTIMMELFTSAGSHYTGFEYADHDGKMPRKPIYNPCLCMYPVTTPRNFHEALSGREAVDGFLARFLIFESDDFPIEPRKEYRNMEELPQALIDSAEYWKAQPFNSDGEGNMGDYYIRPRVVQCTDAAAKILDDYMLKNRQEAERQYRNKTNLSSIYGRIHESAEKIALLAHTGDRITKEVAQWAVDLSDYCLNYNIGLIVKNVAENDQERTMKKIINMIAEAPNGLPHSTLINRTREMDRKRRNDILIDLINSETIEKCETPAEGRGRNPVVYKIVKKDS